MVSDLTHPLERCVAQFTVMGREVYIFGLLTPQG